MSLIQNYYFDQFKEMYYYEHEQKESINGRIQTPIGFLTLLIALDAFYINSIEDIQNGVAGVIFYVLLGLLSLSLIVNIYYLIRAYYMYTYKYIPTPTVLEEKANEKAAHFETYYDQFKDYYKLTKEECIKNKIDEDMHHYYKSATEINMSLNERKLKYLRKVGFSLIITLILGLFTLIPYLFAHEKNDVQKVEIEKVKELSDSITLNKQLLDSNDELLKKIQEQENQIKKINSELERIRKTKVSNQKGGE